MSPDGTSRPGEQANLGDDRFDDTSKFGNKLEDHPNWKGGRTVTSHGYVMVKAPDHPDAHVNGYIYEHRLVAEQKLGRRIEPDEHVHHKNGEKDDNRPENLEVLSQHEHRKRHRSLTPSDLRDPGEPNPTIECACGCGETFKKYDAEGRPREYAQGHNSKEQRAPVQKAVLDVLAEGPKARSEIVDAVDGTGAGVDSALGVLKSRGRVENIRKGYWAMPGDHDGELSRQEKIASQEEIECACGCGESLTRYDDYGREREFVSGHNTPERESPVQDAVLTVLSDRVEPMKRSEIFEAQQATDSDKSVGAALRRLRDDGVIERPKKGYWKLSSEDFANGGER